MNTHTQRQTDVSLSPSSFAWWEIQKLLTMFLKIVSMSYSDAMIHCDALRSIFLSQGLAPRLYFFFHAQLS